MGVKIFGIIQDRLNTLSRNKGDFGRGGGDYWSDYRMAETLGIPQIRYSKLKKEVGKTAPKLLITLAEIARIELRMSRRTFWQLFEESEK